MDLIPSKTFAPAFKDLFERLRRHKLMCQHFSGQFSKYFFGCFK
ncbi:hypothetical protein [sulfur-oxidizing endosymbiont of Gigantopelta aegis]|nr:hypothetical protein [sulfur-oxidizing endosymbiont of Gigantopelta aegis]